jgi:hypothetical protein
MPLRGLVSGHDLALRGPSGRGGRGGRRWADGFAIGVGTDDREEIEECLNIRNKVHYQY